MRATRLGALTLAAALGVAGCSTTRVITDYDHAADFARYSSFEFMHSQEIASPLLRTRIETAIARELARQGLRRLPGQPDLWIAVHLRLDRQTQVDPAHFGYGWGSWGYWGDGAATAARQAPIGTLIIDVVDAREKKLLWQAVGKSAIDRHATAESGAYVINKAVEKMLAGFPPKKT